MESVRLALLMGNASPDRADEAWDATMAAVAAATWGGRPVKVIELVDLIRRTTRMP